MKYFHCKYKPTSTSSYGEFAYERSRCRLPCMLSGVQHVDHFDASVYLTSSTKMQKILLCELSLCMTVH